MDTSVLFDRYYYCCPKFADGTGAFHLLCRRHLPAHARILEIGPGPNNATSAFLGARGAVIGADISPEGRANPALSGFCVYDGGRLPFGDACFDACVSNYVLEHVEFPERHLGEVARVLKPGGVYCFRTPNLRHYVTIAARLLPHGFHLRLANRLRRLAPGAHDPYPAYYRLNSGRAISACSRTVGLEPVHLSYIEAEPSYGRCHPALFYPMMIYERIVNSTERLAPLRMNILAVLEKQGRAGGTRPGAATRQIRSGNIAHRESA